jgi:Spy/CpxP family protein refolding chaperone
MNTKLIATAAVMALAAGAVPVIAQSEAPVVSRAESGWAGPGAGSGPGADECSGMRGGRKARGPNIERLAIILDLTEEQRVELYDVMDEHREQRRAMREAMRESMAAVLTPEQQAKLEALRETRSRHGRGGRRHGRRWSESG